MKNWLTQLGSIEGLAGQARVRLYGNNWIYKAPESWPPLERACAANEDVVLGRTGIRTSFLAMGTGTRAKDGKSKQTELGKDGLARLLLRGYEQGLRLFDAAATYGSHSHVAAALKEIPRERVTILTKTMVRDAAGVRSDLERFLKELGTDYIDIFLLHCLKEGDWPSRYGAAMDVLSQAKERGLIRAHGCSCHGIAPLRSAAEQGWVDISLVRLNAIGVHMDGPPGVIVPIIRGMRAQGKGIIGMKILGQGEMRGFEDAALHFAQSTGVLDCITVGAASIDEQEDLIRRLAAIQQRCLAKA